MSAIKILIDTNVILDVFLSREPFLEEAKKIFELCKDGAVDGYVAAHSITNAFYVLRHDMARRQTKNALLDVCDMLDVIEIDSAKITAALKNESFTDFEDCLQCECAKEACVDCIVTRNVKDFSSSPIAAITPSNFLRAAQKISFQ